MMCNIVIAAIFLLNYGYFEVATNPLRISNANQTDISNYPFMAAINVNLTLRCGGSLINPSHILTAAHCVDGVALNSIQVVVGSSYSWIAGESRNVSQIFIHKDYDPQTYENNICILVLNGATNFNSRNQSIYLPSRDFRFIPNREVTVLGFGATETGYNIFRLRVAGFVIRENSMCNLFYGYELNSESEFCVGDPEEVRQLEEGDDGGPIIFGRTLIGIVSAVNDNQEMGLSIALRVYNYMDFINSILTRDV